jgi:iron complex outermembrane receptor protein
MARPQLGNLNPGGTISTTGTLSITSGNPLLKPFRAKTFDTQRRVVPRPQRLRRPGPVPEEHRHLHPEPAHQHPVQGQTGLPLSLLPANFTGDEVFQVTTPINTPTGASCRASRSTCSSRSPSCPAPSRTGVLLNYTQVKSKIAYQVSPTSATTITDDLLNLSPRSANATLYYDDGTFSARVSGSSAAAFLTRVPGPEQQRRGRQERNTERGPVAELQGQRAD